MSLDSCQAASNRSSVSLSLPSNPLSPVHFPTPACSLPHFSSFNSCTPRHLNPCPTTALFPTHSNPPASTYHQGVSSLYHQLTPTSTTTFTTPHNIPTSLPSFHLHFTHVLVALPPRFPLLHLTMCLGIPPPFMLPCRCH